MNSSSLTFVLKLQDLLSPAMKNAAIASEGVANKLKSQFTGIEYSGKKMGASVNDLKYRLEEVNKIKFGTHIKKEFEAASTAATVLEKQLSKLEGKKGSGGSSGGGGFLGGIIKGNLIADAISGGISMIKDIGIDTYQTSLKNDGLKTAINSTTGGHGREAIQETNFIANKYGLNYEASLEGVKTLTGGLKSLNMPLAEQMKIFEGVSTGVAAMKLGAEQSKGAMLALGQMASKGTVSAEELRGQLGERIPGAFGIAAKSMNMTEKQLGQMMQKGEIAAKDFLPKFAAEMQKTFGADALAAANGPQAVQERFNNALFKMKASIGDGLMPLITPVIEKFTVLAVEIMPYINTGIEWISSGIKSVVDLISGLNIGNGEWGSYMAVIKDLAGHMWSTVKSIFGHIVNIVSRMIEFASKSELVKDIFWAIGKFGNGIYNTISFIGDSIQWIFDNLIMPILNKIEWVYSHIKGFFGGGKTTIEVVDGTAKAAPFSLAPLPLSNSYNPLGGSAFPIYQAGSFNAAGLTNPVTLNAGPSREVTTSNTALGDKSSKSKADGINGGGQRSIVINIAKQIETLAVHVLDAKGGANEIESMVREAMRRVMYSMNGVATS